MYYDHSYYEWKVYKAYYCMYQIIVPKLYNYLRSDIVQGQESI